MHRLSELSFLPELHCFIDCACGGLLHCFIDCACVGLLHCFIDCACGGLLWSFLDCACGACSGAFSTALVGACSGASWTALVGACSEASSTVLVGACSGASWTALVGSCFEPSSTGVGLLGLCCSSVLVAARFRAASTCPCSVAASWPQPGCCSKGMSADRPRFHCQFFASWQPQSLSQSKPDQDRFQPLSQPPFNQVDWPVHQRLSSSLLSSAAPAHH